MLFALIGVCAAPTPALATGNLLVGIEQNGGMYEPGARAEQLDKISGLGAKVARFVLRADRVVTCDPYATGVPATSPANPCYDFTVPDAFVRGASQRNVQVLLTIYGAPKFSLGGTFRYTGTSNAEFQRFKVHLTDFTEAATRRYTGGYGGIPRVARWTIWNEPNGAYFWEPRFVGGKMVVAERYAQLYDSAARRLKAVDPTFIVALGPTAPTPADLKPLDFLRQMLPAVQHLGSPVDAYAHNGYMGAHSPLAPKTKAPAVGLGNVHDLTALLDRFPVTRGKTVWITEFGYMTAPADQVAVSPERQAGLLADSIYYSTMHRRVSMLIWYGLLDDGSATDHRGFQTGLFYARDRCGQRWCPKPSAEVYRHTMWVSNSRPARGGTITIFGQGRLAPSRTTVWSNTGKGWVPHRNKNTPRTGTVLLKGVKVSVPTWFVVCDSSCGQNVKVTPGARPKTSVGTLPTVRLPRKSALKAGIAIRMGCTDCRIASTGALQGAIAGMRRGTVIAKGKVRKVKGGQVVVLRFTAAAKSRLRGKPGARMLVRTRVTASDGSVKVWKRTVILV